MRKDAKSLLDRLNRNDLPYREFDDALSDVEPWPIFKALLADASVVGLTPPPAGVERTASPVLAAELRLPAKAPVASDAVDFFAHYASAPAPAKPAPDAPPTNVRALLGRLAGDN